MTWRRKLPACLVGTSVDDAKSLAEARRLAQIELDLIEEGQDAADDYTAAEVRQIRRLANGGHYVKLPKPRG